MRNAATALGSALALASVSPAVAAAHVHPSPNGAHSVGISVSENPIVEGQPIVIYGRLSGPASAGREVTLYHRTPYSSSFTPVGQTPTDGAGYYAFSRLPERILTDREWFVRSLGARSATVHEHVYAQVSIASSVPSASTIETGPHNPVTFTGVVTPASAGEPIVLQRQEAGGGSNWHTIQLSRVERGGSYSFTHEFRFAGDADVRVLLPRDGVNIASPSTTLEYQIEQQENPALTIDASSDPLVAGQQETISGVVTGAAAASATLYARVAGGAFLPVASTVTDSSGAYQFASLAPVANTFYEVRSGSTSSAPLFLGVKYVVSASAETTTVKQGQPVEITGSVTPATPDHVVYLQELAVSGRWVTIDRTVTAGDSTYQLSRPLFVAGTTVLRSFVSGGPSNQGTASTPISIDVEAVAASELPANGSSVEPAVGVAG